MTTSALIGMPYRNWLTVSLGDAEVIKPTPIDREEDNLLY